MDKNDFGARAIVALARHEKARQVADAFTGRIGAALDRCPETIAAYLSGWPDGSDTSYFDRHGRVKNHLWRAYNDTTECESGYGLRRLDADEQEEQLMPRNGGCRHCLRAWRLIRDLSIARQELGNAKRAIRALGKSAIKHEGLEFFGVWT